ncbi:hypothetical protein UFOVP1282_12 [uncultured Caudovirales phage]|uniref:Uncharacterized protein n=1 Tax=uncultured Caudovirales phage TaxID=2100421 RepID=A0A6J5PDX9_9CAUD|nr:hypothetical protein UFOVP888_13 [uncultured Caudovirales phage]CAB4194726.1 hypothetical protein UFOVP1282_12 [uncultured Caudovirales phage]
MATLRRPALSVELAIADSDGWTLNGGALSKLTFGNVLEGPLSQWEDLRCETVSATWRRGSVSPLDFYDVNPGHASVRVWDPDRNLDPSNTLSPYFARLRAGIPFRLSWTNSETPDPNPTQRRPLFTGYVWSLVWESDYATITGIDELSRLAQVDLTATTSTGSGDTGIQRIQRILTAANNSTPLIRASSLTGRPMAATTLAGNALTQIKTAALSEWGMLVVDPNGTLVYSPEAWSRSIQASLWELNAHPEVFSDATRPGLTYGSVRNAIYATSTAGALTPVSTANQSSIDLYGYNRWTNDTTLSVQADLIWWADVALNLYKANPPGWPQTVGINGSFDNGTNPTFDAYQVLNRGDLIGSGWAIAILNLSASVQICGRTDNYTPQNGWETIFTTFANPYTYTTNYFTLNTDPKDRLDYEAVLK